MGTSSAPDIRRRPHRTDLASGGRRNNKTGKKFQVGYRKKLPALDGYDA
jgi:hypothetical protein